MKAKLIILSTLLALLGCSSAPSDAPMATDQISRVEPPSWWVGMKMPLQLLIQGPDISEYSVAIEGGKGVKIKEIHTADSPNYLFVDLEIGPSAKPGTYYLVFRGEAESFKYPYQIAERGKGSSERKSFTTADMIYLIFPDRFANGDHSNDHTPDTADKSGRDENFGRHGGDIQGIIDHLDYVSELGATAIWSTPLLLDDEPEGSYHGYACSDYYHIDPRMGSNELYRDFVEKAHSKGLKVIMDIVTNHCGTAHWWMKDLPFKDWVHVFPEYTGTNHTFSTNMDPNASKHDLYIQESGWFVDSMPDVNLDNPYTLRYFQQWAIWWIEYSGLDGFRVDTYPYNEKVPMSSWCKAVLDEYPSFNIVGECWTAEHDQLAYWQGGNPNKDGFDSHLPSIMDFPLTEAICEALKESGDDIPWKGGLHRVYECLSHDGTYHDLSKMMIFLANHDHSRLGDEWGGDPKKMKMGLALIATMRGIPQLYNGDEMMFRAKPGELNDGSKRIDFPGGWEGDQVNLFSAESRSGTEAELHDFTARLFNWRKTSRAIQEGKTLHFLSFDNTYAYFRYTLDETVFVFANNSGHSIRVPWEQYGEMGITEEEGTDVISGEKLTLTGLEVPAHEVLILQLK